MTSNTCTFPDGGTTLWVAVLYDRTSRHGHFIDLALFLKVSRHEYGHTTIGLLPCNPARLRSSSRARRYPGFQGVDYHTNLDINQSDSASGMSALYPTHTHEPRRAPTCRHALGSIPQVQKGQQFDAGGGETDSRDKDNKCLSA